MAEYLVRVADDRGHLLEQVENGYSESEVRERFVQQGYLVYWVKPRGVFSAGEFKLGRGGKVSQTRFVIYNQQFLTAAGVAAQGLSDSLAAAAKGVASATQAAPRAPRTGALVTPRMPKARMPKSRRDFVFIGLTEFAFQGLTGE